ncbi:hypothetical protein Pfra02_44620 [Pseudomonas fragi]|nr:hypothetical protein Pfra02_44620 [Pseudomonas fragi]
MTMEAKHKLPQWAVRGLIALAYGALASSCAFFAGAVLPVIIGVGLGITVGLWIKAPKLFKI